MSTPAAGFLREKLPGDLEKDPGAAGPVVGPHDGLVVVGRIRSRSRKAGNPNGAEEDPVLRFGVERGDDVLPVQGPPVEGLGLERLDDDVGRPLFEGFDEPLGASAWAVVFGTRGPNSTCFLMKA